MTPLSTAIGYCEPPCPKAKKAVNVVLTILNDPRGFGVGARHGGG